MQIAHKIELKLNNKQKTYFKKACGVDRFCWNWALAKWNDLYELKSILAHSDDELNQDIATLIKISGMDLKKDFNEIKKEEFPWVMEVTKYAAQQPFIKLQSAWNRYFKKLGNRPRFKKKGKSIDSFYVGGDQIRITGKKIKVPNLGWVRMREFLRFEGKINSATFSRTADRWFVSVQIETENINFGKPHKESIGIDLGINKLATLSNGLTIDSPRPLKKQLRKLKRYQRQLSKKLRAAKKEKRKLKDSKNFQKQKIKVSKLHYRISSQRKDVLQKLTTYLTKNYDKISIEDLHVKGMLKNHKLARAISDVGFGEFRRQLEYKVNMRGNVLNIADRFFASSKTCSRCGSIKNDLTLKDRVYKCSCGHEMDRDFNAAINLENLLFINKKVRPVRSELTPVEITAMREAVYPFQVTSIVESGSKLQAR